jgi:ribonuclease P/MRP protein subunit RPP40
LAAFLDSAHRQQAVVVDGRVSPLSPVISGVPQGTVLGPVLFLLHISDIAREVSESTSTTSYVDDTRVSRSIVDKESDCQALQTDLASICKWAEDVNMVFNSDKFERLRFWPKAPKPDLPYKSPDGAVIEEKTHLRDLRVEFSSDLSFTLHIDNTIAAANKLEGWALRSFRRRSRTVMLTIWKSLIQSKLDYCSQLWSPCDQSSISKLESVARHFTSQIDGMTGKDYWERLQFLRMYSQERRRERYQLIILWKVA